jgi:hypothetical protein
VSLWIKRDVLLPRNRKTHRLAELLAQGGTDLFGSRDALAWRAIAVVVLEQVWAYALEAYPGGDVTDGPAAEWQDAVAPWLTGTTWALRDVRELLTQSGHIVVTRRGRQVLRDWREWTGGEAVRLHKDRKRKRLERAARPPRVRGQSKGKGDTSPALAELSGDQQNRDAGSPSQRPLPNRRPAAAAREVSA